MYGYKVPGRDAFTSRALVELVQKAEWIYNRGLAWQETYSERLQRLQENEKQH